MSDVVVVGAGAAGLAAAREARRQGATVTLISNAAPGGDCTFFGCVPSKAFIAAAEKGRGFAEALSQANSAVAHIGASEGPEVLRSEGIEFVSGTAELISGKAVLVGEKQIEAKKGIVLAVGSKPSVVPVDGLSADDFVTTDTFWSVTGDLSSVAIVGAGPIGCELGMALAKIGVQVSLIDLAQRVLPNEDTEASRIIEAKLEQLGVELHLGQSVASGSKVSGSIQLDLSGGQQIEADRALMAIGRTANQIRTSGVDLELDERGHVVVDERLRTSVPGVHAAGDCTTNFALTTAANSMGRVAGANAVGKKETYSDSLIPRATFTTPEVASIGLTESEAAQLGVGARVAYLPLTEHDRAVASGETDGYIKLIAGNRKFLRGLGGGELLGASIVAPAAGELISELALVMQTKAFVGRIAQTNHAYPSWSYGLAKAAAQFFTEIEGRQAIAAKA